MFIILPLYCMFFMRRGQRSHGLEAAEQTAFLSREPNVSLFNSKALTDKTKTGGLSEGQFVHW